MKVYDFMTTKVESIDAQKTVYDAIERMVDRRFRSLLVRFSGNDTNHGVITARDVVFRVLAQDKDPRSIKIADIASRPIVCIDKDMDLDDAAVLMRENNIARVFICDNDHRIIGMLSLLDVMAGSLITRAREGRDD
jgi:CBS domain-containing protein